MQIFCHHGCDGELRHSHAHTHSHTLTHNSISHSMGEEVFDKKRMKLVVLN